jgi:hypothetical protein
MKEGKNRVFNKTSEERSSSFYLIELYQKKSNNKIDRQSDCDSSLR